MTRLCLVMFAWWLGLCLISSRAASADPGWEPRQTWLFVVGVLEWRDKETFDSFPVEERRDGELVELFKEKGVPASQIVYLQDKQATQQRIESAFAAQLGKIKPGDFLVVYYAGHGYQSDDGRDVYLAPYDAGDENAPGWSVESIPRAIEKHSDASRVLWLIDCCYSGRAAEEIQGRVTGPAYACITSSLASQSSTGRWTFTEAFLDAMRGAGYVDLDRDGRVTLDEFARHVDEDMNVAEEQQTAYAIAGDFAKDTTLAEAEPLANPQIGTRLRARDEAGDWYAARVVDAKGGQFKIHFIGYGDHEDAWVGAAETRPIRPKQFAVGAKVEVLWKKAWYPATILKVKGGAHYIHYTGYDVSWNEWVSSKRIRELTNQARRASGSSPRSTPR